MNYIKQISYAIMVFMVVFVLDFIHTLFSIQHSGINFTMLGMRITTKMTNKSLENYFTLTPKTAICLFAFILIWLAIYYIINKKHA